MLLQKEVLPIIIYYLGYEESPLKAKKVIVKTTAEMYMIDKANKEKFQQGLIQKEKEYEIRDRQILEKMKKANIAKQERKLKEIIKKQKERLSKLGEVKNEDPGF